MSEPSGEQAQSETGLDTSRHAGGTAAKLADVFVFAPIGFLSEAGRLWPEVVTAGRDHFDSVLTIREEAVAHARDWLTARADSGKSEAAAALRGLGLGATGSTDTDGRPPGPAEVHRFDSGPTATATPPVSGPELAIPDYDLLSASQVVPRLDALAAGELEEVKRHEEAHRRRRTILSKISQLQAG